MGIVFVKSQSKNVMMGKVFEKLQSKNIITGTAFVRSVTWYESTQTNDGWSPIEFVKAQMPVVRSAKKQSISGYGYFIAFTIFFDQIDGLPMSLRKLHYRNATF